MSAVPCILAIGDSNFFLHRIVSFEIIAVARILFVILKSDGLLFVAPYGQVKII